MYYNGFLVDTAEAALLHDILLTQKEMLTELKKLNKCPDTEDDCIGLTEEESLERTAYNLAGVTQSIAQVLDSSNVELEQIGTVANVDEIKGRFELSDDAQSKQAEQPKQEKPNKPTQKRKPAKKKTQSRKTTK